MPENEARLVVAVASVRAVEPIDGGDTMAVRMTTAGGDELCVLLPTGSMAEMLFLLAEACGGVSDGAPFRAWPVPNTTHGGGSDGGGAGSR